jgi:hypothetical protein
VTSLVSLILRWFWRANAITQLATPANDTLKGCVARWSSRPQPTRRQNVFTFTPVFPRQLLWLTVIANNQFVFGVNGILAICKRELEQLRFGDCFSRTCFDTQVTVNTTQVVDFVHETKSLTWRRWIFGIVVGTSNIDALGWADTGA